jgi:hypothetical protein
LDCGTDSADNFVFNYQRVRIESYVVQALSVPMQVGLFDRPFMPLKLMSKSWDPCSFNKVPDFS